VPDQKPGEQTEDYEYQTDRNCDTRTHYRGTFQESIFFFGCRLRPDERIAPTPSLISDSILQHLIHGEPQMPPTLANGKICYLELPTTDIARSAEFYQRVFGWNVRKRSDGSTAFDDTVGEVSGSWVLGRAPSSQPGLLFYIMVDNVAETMEAVVAAGGEIVQPIGADAPEITARFRDPGENVIGLYQEPG
jgi:hypothetical protein